MFIVHLAFGQVRWLNPPFGYLGSNARGVSDDGQVVVGSIWDGQRRVACMWYNGYCRILPVPESANSEALSISADGRIIVGYVVVASGYLAVYWYNDQMHVLCPGIAHDVSFNGDTIVGEVIIGDGLTEGFVWKSRGCYLFELAGDDFIATSAYGVSPDGKWAVGVYGIPNIDSRCRHGGISRGFLIDTYTLAWIDLPSLADYRTEDEVQCLGQSYAFAVSNTAFLTVAGSSELPAFARSVAATQWFPPTQIGTHYSEEVDINSYAYDINGNGFIKVGIHDRFGAARWVGSQEENLNEVFAPIHPCGSSLWWADSVSTDADGRLQGKLMHL